MTEGPERTEDGRYILVGDRRWRASDPAIPERLRGELVKELMAARRAVQYARDEREVSVARARVQDAKVALGERGEPWWEEQQREAVRERLAAAMRTLLRKRGTEKTICPSDAARIAASPQWREMMPVARSVAVALAEQGEVELRQRGEILEPRVEPSGAFRVAAADLD